MSKKATEFQKKEMRRMYRGKQIFLRTSCFSITAIFPKKQPYYLDVQEATNSHDYTRKTNNYEMWKKMLADPDWAKYER